MPLSPPAFEAICEIGTFAAASLHIERLQIAAPACLLYKQHQHASVHVHSLHVRHVHAPTKPPV